LTEENYRALKPTDLHHNRSGLSRFLLLQRVEYCANVEADLFLFGPSDRSTNHLAGFAILTVTEKVL
jgi:hypothetical protein